MYLIFDEIVRWNLKLFLTDSVASFEALNYNWDTAVIKAAKDIVFLACEFPILPNFLCVTLNFITLKCTTSILWYQTRRTSNLWKVGTYCKIYSHVQIFFSKNCFPYLNIYISTKWFLIEFFSSCLKSRYSQIIILLMRLFISLK